MRAFSSFFRNIVGPRTFTWQGALAFTLVATVGSIVLYGNQTETDLRLYLVIFLIAQVCALFVYVMSGLCMAQISRHKLRVMFVIASYLLLCFVRAYVAEKLLWRTDSISQNLLMWRFRSNIIVNLPVFVGAAWVMNAREESNNRLALLRMQGDELSKEFDQLNILYSEQRSYGERELALEISSAKQIMDALRNNKTFMSEHESLLTQLQDSVYRVSQAIKTISQGEISKRNSIPPEPTPYFALLIVDRATRERGVSPWFASATGFFFSFAYAQYQGTKSSPILSTLFMASVMMLILLFNRRFIIPRIASWKLWTRIVVFEAVATTVNIWWSFFTTRFVLSQPLPLEITAVAALTSFFVMNILAFMQGVFDQRNDYGHSLENRNAHFARAIDETRQFMALEESTWKQMFVGEISRTPTAANVMLKNISDGQQVRNVEEQLVIINDIWRQVSAQLRKVT